MLLTNPFAYITQLTSLTTTQKGNSHQKGEEERMTDEKGEKGLRVAEDRSAMESARNEEEDEEITQSSLRTTEALLRLIPMSLCVVSLVIMLKDSQNSADYGSISYSDVGAFKYLVHANGICAGYSLLSAVIAAMPRQSTLSKAWTFFFLDQLLTYAILAAGAISMEVLYLAYNGDTSITWSAACGSFSTFCSKATAAIAVTFASVACFVIVSLFSSYKLFSRYSAPVGHHPTKTIECLSGSSNPD